MFVKISPAKPFQYQGKNNTELTIEDRPASFVTGLTYLSMSVIIGKRANQHQACPASEHASSVTKQDAYTHEVFVYHLKTLWLFTRSDLKSMIYPNVVFGLASTMSGPPLTLTQSPRLSDTIVNIPHVVFWLWINLLLFNIANQRLPSSIVEDRLNKPWRPLPSGRISPVHTRNLLLFVVPFTILMSSLFLGAPTETLLLISLTWIYNDLGGGDENFILRNTVNAVGMSIYGSGAIVVACGSECKVARAGYEWIALIGLIVLTTLQVQDMSDQEGDLARGRKTMPLVIGDKLTRWTIGVGVMGWSMGAPFFWKAQVEAYVPCLILGGSLSLRTLLLRSVEADERTWKLWCLWMISLYLLPVWLLR